jgi:hypothetical protein
MGHGVFVADTAKGKSGRGPLGATALRFAQDDSFIVDGPSTGKRNKRKSEWLT